MIKRNLNLGTDYISDSDELVQTEFDFLSDDEINDEIDRLYSQL